VKPLVFSGAVFLFAFLPLLLGVYYIVPGRFMEARNRLLLVASLLFYAWGEPVWVLLLIVSASTDYVCGRLLGRLQDPGQTGKEKARKAVLLASLCTNLGLLGTFKYLDFFLESLGLLIGRDLPLAGLTLPIGISFYTFQTLSYTIDVYRGKVEVQKSFPRFLLFVSLFPQLMAGPIVRYSTVEHQLAQRRVSLDDFSYGIQRFIVGFGKKMLIANPLGAIAAEAFGADAALLSPGMAWLGAFCWSMQVFYDFSGYSDMAIGLGRLFGFRFEENFVYPYIAQSITGFWKRWHISLATWFRDYVYIPLGGNRKGPRRQVFNILLVWGLTGLWHGAAWNFVLWGLYYGVLLVLEKFVWGRAVERLPRAFRHLYTLTLTLFGMVIVNANSLRHIGEYFAAMFGANGPMSGYLGGAARLILDHRAEFLFAILLATPIAKLLGERLRQRPWGEALRLAGLMALFALGVISLVKSSYNPFIYFRF
jgi:alginate O-acetyltransferase complex protein AlgI